ncbi:MAG: hypothetical protein JXR91_03000, partial [Deltaproteobacteria bacterium]|nr:hypothetical protein [Deltaproteobacteria bacterium]
QGNSATDHGGAIRSDDSSATSIAGCLFNSNSAQYGGAAFFGGASQNAATTAAIIKTTMWGNHAVAEGGAIYNRATLTINDTIIWGNTAPDASQWYFEFSDTVTVTYSDVEGSGYNGTDGVIAEDPLFTDTAADDFTLQTGSPAIGTASDSENMGAF